MKKRFLPLLSLLIFACVSGCTFRVSEPSQKAPSDQNTGREQTTGIIQVETTADNRKEMTETVQTETTAANQDETTVRIQTETTADGREGIEISRIDVRHSSFGRTECEFRIELDEKSFRTFMSVPDFEHYEPRDAEAENEGFTYVCALSETDMETFLDQCNRLGFLDWQDKYIEVGLCDGHQWGITVLFKDGTTKEIIGSNAYPDTWNEMAEAFLKLTDENVLLVRSD